jgi:hypothetical protein
MGHLFRQGPENLSGWVIWFTQKFEVTKAYMKLLCTAKSSVFHLLFNSSDSAWLI